MRSLLSQVRRRALGAALLPCALFAVACGGGNKETLEKRVANLQEELTRVQNTNDRLAERVQALEIVGMRAPKAAPEAAPEAAPAAEPGSERVARPTLKVVKLAPGATAPAGEPEAETPAAEDEKGPRPVIKDHGVRAPAWAKPPAPRATGAPMGQNAGARRPAPQGT
ncbi:MAG: hypothetical protein HS104_34320 [Polyangiaceae bacterium]|nr:hypothetical protein [Polyangiaceae bacterium]MCE7892942.1 hypothetical protein [Sorangiineae bacterium PRO1]MCL4754440.1 hypothetical protein [Myxococcales bacterium]